MISQFQPNIELYLTFWGPCNYCCGLHCKSHAASGLSQTAQPEKPFPEDVKCPRRCGERSMPFMDHFGMLQKHLKSPSIYGDGSGMLLKLGLAKNREFWPCIIHLSRWLESSHDGGTRVSHDYPLRGEARNPWVFQKLVAFMFVCMLHMYIYI